MENNDLPILAGLLHMLKEARHEVPVLHRIGAPSFAGFIPAPPRDEQTLWSALYEHVADCLIRYRRQTARPPSE